MPKEYFIVSLDFDGVLAQGYKAKIKYAKELFNIDLSIDQTKEAAFNALMGKLGRKDINYRSLMDPINEHHIMEYEVPDYCIPVLKRLYAQGCRFVIITSRNAHDYPYAAQFAQAKFGTLIKYLHNTNNQPKGELVKRVKPRIHVDDDIKKLVELLDYPVELVYYRQPENAGKELPAKLRSRIWEASSFADVEIIINHIRQLHAAICAKKNIPNVWANNGRIFAILHSSSKAEIAELLKYAA